MSTEVWIALLGGLFSGGGLTSLTSYLRDRSSSQIAARQQAYDHSAGLITRLETRVGNVEQQLATCQEHHSRCERDLGVMQGRLEEMGRLVRQNSAAIAHEQEPGPAREPGTETVIIKPAGLGNIS